MKKRRGFVLALVTAPDRHCARKLARAALAARLAACVNLVPSIESHYRWRGKIEMSREVLLILKTRVPRLRALESLVLSSHPYDTPEFVVLQVNAGNDRYLQWWSENVSKNKPRKRVAASGLKP